MEDTPPSEPTSKLQGPHPHMTLTEIIRAFPDQHIVIGDVDFDQVRREIKGGVVIGHSPNRKEALDMARPHLPDGSHFACYFTGKIRRSLVPARYRSR